jgi:hypothetical protein
LILENELKENNVAFSIAVDTQNEKSIENLQQKIQDIRGRLDLLK